MRFGNEHQNSPFWNFTGGSMGKNPPANAGDTDSVLVPGRFHMPRGS